MKITWQIDDDYTGPLRPHMTIIDEQELADCQSEEEREELINDYIREDFAHKISWQIISTDEE